jgi:hypothetical protein
MNVEEFVEYVEGVEVSTNIRWNERVSFTPHPWYPLHRGLAVFRAGLDTMAEKGTDRGRVSSSSSGI